MFRDLIVVGVRDRKLSVRMQLDAELTLEKATTTARQTEGLVLQLGLQESERRLQCKLRSRLKLELSSHTTGKCPAQKATCNKCHRKGRFARVCKGRASVREIVGNNDALLEGIARRCDDKWMPTVDVNRSPVTSKMYTGGDVIVMLHHMYERDFKNLHLQKPDNVLRGRNQREVPVSGMITTGMSYRYTSSKGSVYILECL
ncbi:hypothetical protein HPB52_019146 [Rhipicephalus sanguineus]|uniref:Tick transposon n=1 Tax=Rhipicephalus sanguineus TaxID=34632 RepID=A0A9D4TBB5_RHISA|nr:hypothetical protein HPB52_019146 [Rhipicephalus sanguineus]